MKVGFFFIFKATHDCLCQFQAFAMGPGYATGEVWGQKMHSTSLEKPTHKPRWS